MSLENRNTFFAAPQGIAVMYSAQLRRISSAYSNPYISEMFLRLENSTAMTDPECPPAIPAVNSCSKQLRFGILVAAS